MLGIKEEKAVKTERNTSLGKTPAKRILSSREREEFESILEHLTIERDDIFEATIFSMDHAEAADEVGSLFLLQHISHPIKSNPSPLTPT